MNERRPITWRYWSAHRRYQIGKKETANWSSSRETRSSIFSSFFLLQRSQNLIQSYPVTKCAPGAYLEQVNLRTNLSDLLS